MKTIGIHILTAFPPSNPNRDENGQPKSAIVGGVLRQRISSQCIKRAWRLSESMNALAQQRSTRTREIGFLALNAMTARAQELGVPLPAAHMNVIKRLAECFGKVAPDAQGLPATKEVVVLGPEERGMLEAVAAQFVGGETTDADVLKAIELVKTLVEPAPRAKKSTPEASAEAAVETPAETKKGKKTDGEQLQTALAALLQRQTVAVDTALFGRMRASAPALSVDASVYVSHPLTTGKAALDADFWTATDDLGKEAGDDIGAGGMGDVEFGAGTFYTYVEVNAKALEANLGGDAALARETIGRLLQAMATVTPSGHKTTFGNAVRASYLRIEVGQPSGNLFCHAFETPVTKTPDAIAALRCAAQEEADAFALDQAVFEFERGASLDAVLTASLAAI